MKTQYENRSQMYLSRRTYTIIRVDGKAFHGLLRHCARPFDEAVVAAMDAVALYLCAQLQGSEFAFSWSDEVSILLTDFATIKTDALFDGNVQKVVSVSAAMASVRFNSAFGSREAIFDSRAFTIPDPVEVENYFIWRQQDATRNSVSMAAQCFYSPKELHGRDSAAQQEMLFKKNINWDAYRPGLKRGRVIAYRVAAWVVEEPPVFTQDRAYLRAMIPRYPTE